MNIIPKKKSKSVDEIVGLFTKTVEDLNMVAAENEGKVFACTEEMQELEMERDKAAAEARRAKEVAQKLEGLVS